MIALSTAAQPQGTGSIPLTADQPQAAALPLAGLRGLIVGVANEHSIAWGCARQMQAQGARLVLSCLNEKARPHVAPLAEAIDAPLLSCDVSQPGQMEAMVRHALEHLGGLDFVVHAIAWAPADDLHGRVIDSSPEGFNQAMRISCHSFSELARLCEPALARQGGTLLTLSYLGAEGVVPHYGLMGPVKAALEALVRYMAVELGPQGVRVHALSPGPVPTRAASGLVAFDQLMAHASSSAPLRRLVTLDEIGACAAFLVGPGATGMTGQTIFVDAGVHALR
ncbi:enoyl-ACP reductase FabI [Paucibacter sp. APW11]|uniref:Enoyl-[acyl-carrier-protein] reductase [NADH] n=1 Tax=Roseateles aquae TaxID=3077235 RepID=A0ABU3PET1_9BURK|nr:enoyl-ACP reductase FabI [Paucibacter sp. APW11]MDT9001074.1 enoyl-ACP reductase FabI [Paucibacter sp. APW11]